MDPKKDSRKELANVRHEERLAASKFKAERDEDGSVLISIRPFDSADPPIKFPAIEQAVEWLESQNVKPYRVGGMPSVLEKTPYGVLHAGKQFTIGEGDQELLFEVVTATGSSWHGHKIHCELVHEHYRYTRYFKFSFKEDGTVVGFMEYTTQHGYVEVLRIEYDSEENEWRFRDTYQDWAAIYHPKLKVNTIVRRVWQSSRPRDMQKQKLYDAERACRADWAKTKLNKQFDSIAAIQEYVDEITSTQWWEARYRPSARTRAYVNGHTVEVAPGRGRQHTALAHGWDGKISLPRWAWQEIVIIHELAHLLVRGKYASHGPEYAKTFLQMVRRFMGAEAHQVLKDKFKLYKVKHVASYDALAYAKEKDDG